ncbi:MAG: His/Gly/Thr/Pro-type tRNA ligase C-terminal domain-containing protein, partial [Solirubrobacteraceae bacterium]
GGGGRYDGLVEQLGGPATPGVGWAAGIERIVLAAGDDDGPAAAPVFVAVAKPELARRAFAIARELRGAGVTAQVEQAGRSMKGQMKHADRIGARAPVIVGDEIEVKDMASGEQRTAADPAEALRMLERA